MNNKEFDLWADGYDKAVGISDDDNTYPFAGYKDVMNGIFQTIMEKPGDEWDDEEAYFVIDELQKALPGLEFTKISHCAGIVRFNQKK